MRNFALWVAQRFQRYDKSHPRTNLVIPTRDRREQGGTCCPRPVDRPV